MDNRKPSRSRHDLGAATGLDPAPIESAVAGNPPIGDVGGHPRRLASDTVGESSHVVYCGSAQEVSEGFAIALRIMGVEEKFFPGDIASSAINPTREDH